MRSGASGAPRRCMSRRVFCRFCHARSRVPMVFGPFHYCAFCERAAPDAPETIDDQRRGTGCRYRTIYGGSRGSASLPAPAKWLGPIGPITPTRSSRLGVHFFTRGGVPTDFGPLTDGGGPGAAATAFFSSSTRRTSLVSGALRGLPEISFRQGDLRSRSPAG